MERTWMEEGSEQSLVNSNAEASKPNGCRLLLVRTYSSNTHLSHPLTPLVHSLITLFGRPFHLSRHHLRHPRILP